MKRTILMLALFPFIHSTAYKVEFVSCEKDKIVVKHEQEDVNITLFNTKIVNEKGWKETCEIIENAKELKMEIDPSSKIEETLPVYLFADDTLVQEELMKKSYAYLMIKNPEYTYEKRLEAAYQTTQTLAKSTDIKTDHGYAIVAPLYLGAVFLIWFFMAAYMFWKHRKKDEKSRKKEM
ncbi:thermonuclease [Amedibacillus sp. YH-ame6]